MLVCTVQKRGNFVRVEKHFFEESCAQHNKANTEKKSNIILLCIPKLRSLRALHPCTIKLTPRRNVPTLLEGFFPVYLTI